MITIVKEEDKHLLADVNLIEANLSNANDFKAHIVALLDEKQKSIVLNMAKVAYIDSSFLGAIVAALKHAISKQLDIILVELQPDIHDLIKLIRLDKVFEIYKDYSEVQ